MPLANPNFFFSITDFLSVRFVFYTKNRPRPKRSGPTLGIPSLVVLSREYRFGASCWRRNAQNAEYSKNRHCSYSVDGKQEGAVVGIRVRACEAGRARGCGCVVLAAEKRVAHGLQLLSGDVAVIVRAGAAVVNGGMLSYFRQGSFKFLNHSAKTPARGPGRAPGGWKTDQAFASSLCSALRNCVANRMAVHVTAITSATGSARYTAVVRSGSSAGSR